MTIIKNKLEVHPLDKSRWNDFVKLFGERGACCGCWCMSWRLKSSEFEKMKGESNKKAIRKIVNKDEPTGVIGYMNDEPVGWCAVAPREKFIRLENSRVLRRVDDQPVWSVTCFFIDKRFRRKGLSVKLLKGTLDYCKKKKIKIVEAYPIEPKKKDFPDVFAWTGISSAFLKAGFKGVIRHSETRPILRYYL